jgi:DNA-binding PadR family transcriptional regulator
MENIATKRDILLVFIGMKIDDSPTLISPIQIMKSMFLLKERVKLQEFYDFVPYLYGPCSFNIYSDLIALKHENLIEEIPSASSWNYYRTTPKGEENVKELVKKFDKALLENLKEIKKLITGMTFIQLLDYVYKKYPEFAKNSIMDIEVLK